MGFLSEINGIDPGSLDALQRIFLVTDGTLTDTVEAVFLEPISLVKIEVNTFQAPAAVQDLELETGANVMERKILLQGKNTGINYVYAESLLALDLLAPAFRDGLLNSNEPVGRLWNDHRIETWKEILSVARRPAGVLAGYFGISEESVILIRRYRAHSAGRPIMATSEHFPQAYRNSPGIGIE